jgi:hypothetical protein
MEKKQKELGTHPMTAVLSEKAIGEETRIMTAFEEEPF